MIKVTVDSVKVSMLSQHRVVVLKEEEQQYILDLEKKLNRRIIIVQRDFHLEQYEIDVRPDLFGTGPRG